MKRWVIILSLVVILVTALVYSFFYIPKNLSEDKKAMYTDKMIQYIKNQIEETRTDAYDINDTDGRIIGMHMTDSFSADRLITYIKDAVDIQLVKAIPELDYPIVNCGDNITGSNRKLYYSISGRIIEFTLDDYDSMVLLLYITQHGTPYQEVRDYFISKALNFLQEEIVIAEKDILTVIDGNLSSIEIKSKETLEMIINCITNCQNINDYTNTDMSALDGPVIYVNDDMVGNTSRFFLNNFIGFYFAENDSIDFYNYLKSLVDKY